MKVWEIWNLKGGHLPRTFNEEARSLFSQGLYSQVIYQRPSHWTIILHGRGTLTFRVQHICIIGEARIGVYTSGWNITVGNKGC